MKMRLQMEPRICAVQLRCSSTSSTMPYSLASGAVRKVSTSLTLKGLSMGGCYRSGLERGSGPEAALAAPLCGIAES